VDQPSDERHRQLQDNEPIEVAIAVPGVLFLLAILLAIPFQDRYSEVTQFEKVVFIVALVATSFSLCSCSRRARSTASALAARTRTRS
jgi:hypothetical protein